MPVPQSLPDLPQRHRRPRKSPLRHEDGRRCLVARRLDARRIELEQELSALYRIALCDMRRKMLSRKLHGIHADVDQEIHPV